jgi:hypothetical protein
MPSRLCSEIVAEKSGTSVCHFPAKNCNLELIHVRSERSPPLPNAWFGWFRDFYKIPSVFVLNHSSLDGYLFLRFLRVLGVICLVGIGLLWPILLPLHATGGAGNRELDALTLGNVVSPNRFYAHAILAWVYFSE